MRQISAQIITDNKVGDVGVELCKVIAKIKLAQFIHYSVGLYTAVAVTMSAKVNKHEKDVKRG